LFFCGTDVDLGAVWVTRDLWLEISNVCVSNFATEKLSCGSNLLREVAAVITKRLVLAAIIFILSVSAHASSWRPLKSPEDICAVVLGNSDAWSTESGKIAIELVGASKRENEDSFVELTQVLVDLVPSTQIILDQTNSFLEIDILIELHRLTLLARSKMDEVVSLLRERNGTETGPVLGQQQQQQNSRPSTIASVATIQQRALMVMIARLKEAGKLDALITALQIEPLRSRIAKYIAPPGRPGYQAPDSLLRTLKDDKLVAPTRTELESLERAIRQFVQQLGGEI